MFRSIALLLSLLISGCTAAAQSPAPSASSHPAASPAPTESPQRLTIKVTVADPADLKVAAGDRLRAGDLIADRARQRQRLQTQQQQLAMTLQRLQTATVTAPLAPAPVPSLAALPSASYLEEQAAIQRAQVAVDQAERALQQKQQELEYLQTLRNLDPLVLQHEQAQLTELQQAHTAAVRDYQLAAGRRGKAQDEQAYRQYQHRLAQAEQVQQTNQEALAFQQQWGEYEQRLRDREVQVAQTRLKLDEVEHAIATLAVVRAPYAGRIRRIKWLGQGADGALAAEVTLVIRADAGSGGDSTLSGEQPGVSGEVDRGGDRPVVRDRGH
jgi:hypothetical protein